MRALLSVLSFAVGLGFLIGAPYLSADEEGAVHLLRVSGIIDPATARYVNRGLEEARSRKAAALVMQIDTPGGMDGSMRTIVQGILNSPVPVAVYVSPQGARAASAGAFILVSSHIAAMAPGTNVGAAHPVQIGAGGGGKEKEEGEFRKWAGKPSVVEQKITNDAVAYIRSIAEIRGRDLEWVEGIVRESKSSSAEEAKEKKVIDLIAADLDDLVRQIDGRQVKTVFGVVTLNLKDKPMRVFPMSFLEKMLHQLAHPNLAYVFLLLGIYGMIFELSTPGAVFPGVLGAIFLVLALLAMETLDVNWAGVVLIGLAILFFIADIKVPGYGALTIGGIIAFALGSALLFPGQRLPELKLPWKTIGAATAVTAAFFIWIVATGMKALARKVAMGVETLIGSTGVAKTDLRPEGTVNVKGEDWRARTKDRIKKGSKVKVQKVEGLMLYVTPHKEGG
ncbi:MAG: nodulation protein NfeD [Candidatus Omnitrophica bacterium]|nr:nodulation protein NfeD [Candidatus Omnitrophota bacterium]